MIERLHKVLAGAGFGSRRECERLIRMGEVEVEGKVVREMGLKVDPDTQRIKCAGRYLKPERRRTFILNKPRGVISTNRDERGRRSVRDLMRGVRERIFPVGRLDAESQGLLIMTNDGELCNLMTHPRYQIARTYHVIVKGHITPQTLGKMRGGVWLAEGRTGPIQAVVKHRERLARGEGEKAVLEVTVREGMNREVRRLFARFGIRVKRLKRIRLGSLQLGSLSEGQFRELTPAEVEKLKHAARAHVAPPGGKAIEETSRRTNGEEE